MYGSRNPFVEITPYPGPVLIVHGTDDNIVHPDYVHRAFEAYSKRQAPEASVLRKPEYMIDHCLQIHYLSQHGHIGSFPIAFTAYYASAVKIEAAGCIAHFRQVPGIVTNVWAF